MARRIRLLSAAMPIALLCGAAACSGPDPSKQGAYNGPGGPLSGAVTFKGQPMLIGYVLVRPTPGANTLDQTGGKFALVMKTDIKDGRYSFARAPAGAVQLRVEFPGRPNWMAPKDAPGNQPPNEGTRKGKTHDAVEPFKGSNPALAEQWKLAMQVAMKYKSFENANLTATVNENVDNAFDIALDDQDE